MKPNCCPASVPPGAWAGLEPVPDYLRARCVNVRDVCGNPFRPAALDEGWRRGPGNAAVKLAQGIYEERGFDRLPILADALEEAGCPNAEIAAHCRAPDPHLRGCWAVDLLPFPYPHPDGRHPGRRGTHRR